MNMSELFRLDGKVAIVTGSSRGIGRAIAESMAELGAAVVISSRKLEPCEAVRDGIIAKGGKAIAATCNTGSKEALAALLQVTEQTYGRLDAVVANVAVNPYYGKLSGVSDEQWDKIMSVNVKSTLWLANMAMPIIAKHGAGGTFTLISSIGALRGSTAIPAYNVSKLAEIGLMQALAVEWGKQNIRVNAILPGLVRTDFAKALWDNPALLKTVEAGTPLGRIGEVEDLGGVGAFLATPAARYITGQTLVVDGGSVITSHFE
jgi:NAD(P)-dependent dehydrogenase (short-subunit alcohol dehydrogenase family)